MAATTTTLGLLNCLPSLPKLPRPSPSPLIKLPSQPSLSPPLLSSLHHEISAKSRHLVTTSAALSLPLLLSAQVSFFISMPISILFSISPFYGFKGCVGGRRGVRDPGRSIAGTDPSNRDERPLLVHALGWVLRLAMAPSSHYPERDQWAQTTGQTPSSRRRHRRSSVCSSIASSPGFIIPNRVPDPEAHWGTVPI